MINKFTIKIRYKVSLDDIIQTIITSNENAIHNSSNLLEIKNEYLTDYLTNNDKITLHF